MGASGGIGPITEEVPSVRPRQVMLLFLLLIVLTWSLGAFGRNPQSSESGVPEIQYTVPGAPGEHQVIIGTGTVRIVRVQGDSVAISFTGSTSGHKVIVFEGSEPRVPVVSPLQKFALTDMPLYDGMGSARFIVEDASGRMLMGCNFLSMLDGENASGAILDCTFIK